MNILVGMDGNGHFFAANLLNRTKILKHLKKDVHDGDYWPNVVVHETPELIEFGLTMPQNEFEACIDNLCQRGTIEILTIE